MFVKRSLTLPDKFFRDFSPRSFAVLLVPGSPCHESAGESVGRATGTRREAEREKKCFNQLSPLSMEALLDSAARRRSADRRTLQHFFSFANTRALSLAIHDHYREN